MPTADELQNAINNVVNEMLFVVEERNGIVKVVGDWTDCYFPAVALQKVHDEIEEIEAESEKDALDGIWGVLIRVALDYDEEDLLVRFEYTTKE